MYFVELSVAICLLCKFRVLNRRHHTGPVATQLVSVHQEFQASQEVLETRDQQVLRDHPAVTDMKDPWVHEETRVMKELVEDRDLKDPRVLRVLPETRVKEVLGETKVPQAPRELQGSLDVIGNSACLKV